MNKMLSPWRKLTDNWAIYKLGDNSPFIEILKRTYTEYHTNGLLGSGLEYLIPVGDHSAFGFSSLELTIERLNKIFEENGYIILTEEKYEKLQVLV